MDERSDNDLLTALRRGDLDAGGELYDRYAGRLLSYFLKRTGCAETSADLAHETMAEIFSGSRRWRDLGKPAGSWIFSIARRQLSHWYKHQRVATRARYDLGSDPIDIDADSERQIEQLLDVAGLRAAFQRAWSDLTDQQADVIRLRVFEGLTHPEIAHHLQITENAAKTCYSRALTRIRGELE